jgi:hypothetical protein
MINTNTISAYEQNVLNSLVEYSEYLAKYIQSQNIPYPEAKKSFAAMLEAANSLCMMKNKGTPYDTLSYGYCTKETKCIDISKILAMRIIKILAHNEIYLCTNCHEKLSTTNLGSDQLSQNCNKICQKCRQPFIIYINDLWENNKELKNAWKDKFIMEVESLESLEESKIYKMLKNEDNANNTMSPKHVDFPKCLHCDAYVTEKHIDQLNGWYGCYLQCRECGDFVTEYSLKSSWHAFDLAAEKFKSCQMNKLSVKCKCGGKLLKTNPGFGEYECNKCHKKYYLDDLKNTN